MENINYGLLQSDAKDTEILFLFFKMNLYIKLNANLHPRNVSRNASYKKMMGWLFSSQERNAWQKRMEEKRREGAEEREGEKINKQS